MIWWSMAEEAKACSFLILGWIMEFGRKIAEVFITNGMELLAAQHRYAEEGRGF